MADTIPYSIGTVSQPSVLGWHSGDKVVFIQTLVRSVRETNLTILSLLAKILPHQNGIPESHWPDLVPRRAYQSSTQVHKCKLNTQDAGDNGCR